MNSLKEWLKCKRCALCKTRRAVVIGRGKLPADILFIGESPGKSEDLRGEAFIGPSGRLLDKLIVDAVHINRLIYKPSIFITNTVGCRPCDEKFGANRQPNKEEILSCMQRVLLINELCNPAVIIFLGKIAEDYYKGIFNTEYSLPHPAYLLRQGGDKSPFYLQTVRKLSNIIKENVCR